jgi:hypothetical protein
VSVRSTVAIRALSPAGPTVSFELLELDDLTGLAGGWESLPRPRRSAAAGWVGGSEMTWTATLMLDGVGATPGADRSVERQCRLVQGWGVAQPKSVEPAKLSLTGPLLVPQTWHWVLQDVAWGERIRNSYGLRVQQVLTVTLLRYIAPTLVRSPARRSRARRGGS